MPRLDDHRRAVGSVLEVLLLEPPFSFFDFIETRFGDIDCIRRIFSLARSADAASLVLETLPATGILAEENEEILDRYPSYRNPELLRLSFWKKTVANERGLSSLSSADLVGYAILKRDVIAARPYDAWHVFEAVFAKYPHEHNCIPRPGRYRVGVGTCSLEIEGVLFCQQNGLNKACAQVALRSLLSRVLPEGDISYRKINALAAMVQPGFDPGKGLTVPQIRAVLTGSGLDFHDVDYSQGDNNLRQELPYQKFAYAGLESGCGALVGFRLAGRELTGGERHIIPYYGHTFNKDTWVPNADIAYFHIGEGVGYVPSESWTSSFIGHDDNFGPNFCIPRLYIERDQVDYVVEVFRPGVRYSGLQAEAVALNILYSLLPNLLTSGNPWITRLIEWTKKQQVIFRAQAVTAIEYAEHVRSLVDWDKRTEQPALCDLLQEEMPPQVWAVEISTPHLFPANQRKLGEIVLDATQHLNLDDEAAVFDVFILARLPGLYLFGGDLSNGSPQFTLVPSAIVSHTALIELS